jgi:mono/diheme cytochrome c family protein
LLIYGVALAMLVACGGSSGDDDGGNGGDGGASDGAAAMQLFADKGCAECHGAEGEGTDVARTNLQETRLIIQQFEARVRNGRGSAMPGLDETQITDEEIRILHDWLKAN